MVKWHEQTVGVEIEFLNASRHFVAHKIAIEFGVDTNTITTISNGYVVKINGKIWSIVYDGSVSVGEKGGEVVSPILDYYQDLETLQRIIRVVKEHAETSASKCGIHVHVDGARHTPASVVRLLKIVATRETLLYKSLAVNTGRLGYCDRINKDFITYVESKAPSTLHNLREVWYRLSGFIDDGSRYNRSRYRGINLHALFTRHKTIEFRLFNGTLNAGRIRTYMILSLMISAQSLNQRGASSRKRNDSVENERYNMRCWLLRLGMIGKEFENPRAYMAERLGGCLAWRYPEENGRVAR